jgi:hypothetical protein
MLTVDANTSNRARFITTSACPATFVVLPLQFVLHFAVLDIEYFDLEILA